MPRQSFVWKYFRKSRSQRNDDGYTCKLCSRELKTKVTTNLKNHLLSNHVLELSSSELLQAQKPCEARGPRNPVVEDMIEEQRISISLGTLKQLSLKVEVPVLESEGSIERKIRTVHLLAKYGKRITESPIAAVRRRKRAARIESSSSDEDEIPLPKKRNLTKDIDHDDDSHDDEKRKENRDNHDKSNNNNQPMERGREIEEAVVGEQKGTVDNSNKNKSASASKEVDLSLRKSDVEEFLRSSAYRKYQLFNIQDAIKTIAETLLKVISLRTAIKQGTGDKDAKEAEKVALCQTISLDVFDIFDKFKGRQDNQFRVIIGFTVYQVYEQFRILWERNKTGKDVQFLWCKMLFNTCLRQSHFAHSSVIEFISKMNHEDYELVKKLTQELANGETSNNKKQPNKRRKSKDLQVDSKKTGLDRLDKPAETDSAPKPTTKSYKTVVGNSEDKSNISQSNKTVENSREMSNISGVTNSEPNILNTCGEINDALKTVTVINTLKKPIDTTSNANSTKSPSSIKTIIREKDLVAINRLGINNSIDHHFKKSLDTTTSSNSIDGHLNIDQTKSTNHEAETSDDQTSNVFIDKTNHANNATISIVTKDKPNNATSNDDTINECTISIVNNVENSNETSDKTRIVTSNAKNDTISTAANIDRSNNVIDKTRLVTNSALTDKTSNAIEDNESDDEIEFLSCVKSTSKPKACVAPHQTNSDLPIPGDGVSSIQIVNVRGGLISYSCILYTGCSDLLQFSDPTRNIVSSKMATALSLPLTPQFNSILATFPVLGVLKQVEKDMNVNSMGIDAEQISIMYKIFFINLVKYYKAWIQCVQDIDKRNEINSYFTCISSLNEDDIESMPDNLAEITADKMSTFVCLKEIVKSKLNIGGTRPCTHAQYTVNAKSSRCQELILIKNSMIVAYKRQTTYEPLRANNMTVCKLPRVKSSLSDDALPEVCLFSLITSVNMLLLFIPDTRTELRHTLTLQHDLAIRTFLASHNIEIALKDKEVARQINIRDKIEHMETLAEYITRVQEESSFAFAQQLSKSSNKSRSLPHWPGDPPPTSQPQSRPSGSVTTAPGAPSAASSASVPGLTTKFIVLPGSNDIVPHTGTTIKPMPDLAPINYVPPGQGSPVVSSGGPLVNIGPLINIVRPMNPAVPIVSGGTPQTSNTGTLRYHLTTPRGPPNTHTTGSHTPSSTTQHLRTLRFVPYEMNPNNAAGGSKEASKLRSMMPKPYGSTAPNSACPVPTSSSEASNSTSTAADSSFATPYALSTAPCSSSTAPYSSSTAPYASFTEPYASSAPRRPLSSPTSSAQNNPQLTPPPHYRPTTSQGSTGSPQTVSQKPNSRSRAGPGTGPRAVRGGRSPSSRGRGGRGIRLVDPTRLMASHLIAQQDSGGTGGGGVGGDVALGNLLEDLLQDVPCASPSSSNVTHCASCGAPAELQCSGCNNLCYCSAECQLRHWESAHSTQCALSS